MAEFFVLCAQASLMSLCQSDQCDRTMLAKLNNTQFRSQKHTEKHNHPCLAKSA